MNDIERMQQIVDESQEIEAVLKKAGAFGISMAASLFRLAMNEEKQCGSPTNSNLAAKAYYEIMKTSAERK